MGDFDKVMDSGVRENFQTGSRRDTRAGKGRFDLLPPYAIYRLARHFENGSIKYGDRNWELGQPLSRYLDSAMRHLFKFLAGFRDEDHLAACAWNCCTLMDTQRKVELGLLPAELNDLPSITDESTTGWASLATITEAVSEVAASAGV